MKTTITITCDMQVAAQAKKHKHLFNISQTCEDALRKKLKQIVK